MLASLLAASLTCRVQAQARAAPLQTLRVKTPADFGYHHLVVMFGRDSVDVLILAKKGEELVRKPLLL